MKKNPRGFDYVEAWHAIAEANRIFGFDAWDRETVDLRLLGEPRKVGENMRVGYSARVRITVRAGDTTIIREGCGFGSGIDRDVDQAHESAIKEAESDAMKRALMTFGNPFGLALYDKAQANVVEARSQAFEVAAAGLRGAADGAEFSAFWSRNKEGLKQNLPAAEYAALVEIMKAEAARFAPQQKAA